MFAGEGDAFRTNRRFKLRVAKACRPSGCRPRSTRSRCTATTPTCGPTSTARSATRASDRHARRHEGAVLGLRPVPARRTSVSMTINGPAPTILAMFMNTAIDQQLDKFAADNGREPTDDEAAEDPRMGAGQRARHGAGRHPEGRPGPEHLHLLDRVQPEGDGRHRRVLRAPRRAQLLFGVDLAAITSPRPAPTRSASSPSRCRNGFTFVEAYLARGMHIDDFAPNLSFFFSNGMDPEYTRAGPRRAAHLGGGDEASATAPTSAARS